MPRLPNFVAVERSYYDTTTDRIVVTLSTRKGTKYTFQLGTECFGPLVVALLSRGREHIHAQIETCADVRPLQLLDAVPSPLADGSVGLLLRLQPDLQLALAVTGSSITALRMALTLVEGATQPRPDQH